MIIRSKAPLRLGLAGGGTDVSPYCDLYGGAILNATIRRYAYATIIPNDCGTIIFKAVDMNEVFCGKVADRYLIDGKLDLHKGVYNRVIKTFRIDPISFELTTSVDAPPGSGLGSSSTLVVAILSAFVELFNLPLGEYEIAKLSYEIERVDLNMAGGRQDQYAATFGGFNFMEFYKNEKVVVNPLRIKDQYLNEIDHNILLYYTGTSRLSAKIIDQQVDNVRNKLTSSVEAMHKLKEQAILLKEAILTGRINDIGPILDFGWESKKKIAEDITNPVIDEIYDTARKAGSTGGKISGAGGGGFMFFYCPGNTRYIVADALKRFGGEFRRFSLNQQGATSWTIR